MTIQHLLDHRLGLGDIFNERWDDAPKDQYIDPQDLFPLFVDESLKFEPGSGKSFADKLDMLLVRGCPAGSRQELRASYALYVRGFPHHKHTDCFRRSCIGTLCSKWRLGRCPAAAA